MEYSEVKNFADAVAKKKGMSNYSVDIKPANAKGEGFLGDIYIVNVENGNKKLNIVVKLALTNKVVRDKYGIKSAYENEITFYSKIYTACKRFQLEKGLKNIYKGVPVYIDSAIEENYEVLALENLRLQGFEVRDKTILFDKLHMESVLKQYAHFHAVSMAFFDQHPEEFGELLNLPITNMWKNFSNDDTFDDIGNKTMILVKNALIEIGENKVADVFDKYCHNFSAIFDKYSTYNGKMKVLLHGDCWSNNIMFKYKETKEGQIIEDLCLIDFQLVQFGSPVLDLAYFIYANANENIYKNLDYYLKFYYDNLSFYVKELGSSAEKIYPMSFLKEEWKQYSMFGFLMGFMILKMKFTVKEDVFDLNDFSEMTAEEYTSKGYDKTMFNKVTTTMVKHFYELGLL